MSKNKLFHFRRKQIKENRETKEAAMDELINLYNENPETAMPADPNDDDSLKDVIEISRQKSRRRFIVLTILILLLCAGSATAGFFYFSKNKIARKESVAINIEGPQKASVGSDVEYLIKYKNTGDINLNQVHLGVVYPAGFILKKTEPNSANHSWQIGPLDPRESGEIRISGRLVDNLATDQKIIATLYYQPENFNSEFSVDQSLSTLLEKPDVEIIKTQLANVNLGQKINLNLKIKNKSTTALNDAQIKIDFPPEFEVSASKPAPTEEKNIWHIPLVAPQSESADEISIDGAFKTDTKFEKEEDRLKKFVVHLYLPGAQNNYIDVMQDEYTVNIIDQPILSYLIINGSAENKNIELGGMLTFSIISRNNGENEYQDLSIKAIIKPVGANLLDWDNINDNNFGKISKTGDSTTIAWTKKEIEDLASLKPKEERTISFSLPIKKWEDFSDSEKKLLATAGVEAMTEITIGNDSLGEPISSSKINLALNSDINFNAKAIYYFEDGTAVGKGPIPLQANKETQLQVLWDMTNHLHEINNIVVSTTLPDNVEFAENKKLTAGEVTYDKANRKVTWTISNLPKGTNEAHANFAIKVTPTAKQVGQIIKLTNITTLTAKDAETGDSIIKTENIINSALDEDPNADTDGKVIK